MSMRNLGDVISRHELCPSVFESSTVYDLAQSLAKARVDAVAVLSHIRALVGIATSRDVAKCVARGDNLRTLKVSTIMTTNPVTLPPTETPTSALSLMRDGDFRHIPIVSNRDASVIGIVDVLHLAYDAITRLQLSYDMIPTRRGFEFMRAARDTIEKHTLDPIMKRSNVATLTTQHSVADACETLVRERLAAVVIVDQNGVLDGIFTGRDLVNRVIVKQLDPTTTPLGDVMTTNPDCAYRHFTILESLQRMQACGYRHLPVVDENTRAVLGLVDVLQLASDAILGLQNLADEGSVSTVGRTLSSRTRPSIAKGFTSLFSSLFSSSYAQTEFVPQVPVRRMRSTGRSTSSPPPKTTLGRSTSFFSMRGTGSVGYMANSEAPPPSRAAKPMRKVPGDAKLASFKFKDINKEWRKIKVPFHIQNGSFDQFMLAVRRRYAGSCNVGSIKVKYMDEDDDEVLIGNDEDLLSCFEDYLESKKKTIYLRVYSAEDPSSSQLQSPVSSAPSSSVASPSRYLIKDDASAASSAATSPSRYLTRDGDERMFVTERIRSTPPKPPSVQEISKGITRTLSRQLNLTPSQQKTSDAHRKMLDGDREAAIELFNEALKLDPNNARALGGRGAAKLFNGSSVGAEEDYRGALALIDGGKYGHLGDLTFQSSIVGLVESLIDQRRYEEAVNEAGRIDADSGNTGCADAFRDELDVSGNAALEALKSSEYGDALSCYNNALRVEVAYLKLSPKESARSSLRLGRAKCYEALQDYDMALDDYEEAVKLEPSSFEGLKGCGKCFAELEQSERALEAYERALKSDPTNDEAKNEIEALRKTKDKRLEDKKAEIAKLGAILGGLRLAGK